MATTSNFGWTTPDDTDLVKDGALAIRTLGNNIDTSLVDLKGGTTGQILSKASNTDLDYTWINNDQGDITEVQAGTGISVASGTGPVPVVTNTVATTFDAKGDLVVGTGADTFAKLTVGSNGDSIYAASAETTGLRFNPPVASLANPLINAGYDVWQRGTSISVAANTQSFTADRWMLGTGANQAFTVSRQTTSDTTNLPNIQFAARVQRNSGQTGTGAVGFTQSIETTNSIPFVGKTVTFSFYARAGANYSPTSGNLLFLLRSGTGTDQNVTTTGFTGAATVASATVQLTTTWQRFVGTGTVASTATQLAAIFEMTPTGTAGANDWFEVTGVQIDLGTWTATTAPTFRRNGRTLQGELAACQRYFWQVLDGSVTSQMLMNANAFTSTDVRGCLQYPVTMRVAPSLVQTSGTNYFQFQGATGDSFDSLLIVQTSTQNTLVYAQSGQGVNGLVAGQAGTIFSNNAATRVAFSAEL